MLFKSRSFCTWMMETVPIVWLAISLNMLLAAAAWIMLSHGAPLPWQPQRREEKGSKGRVVCVCGQSTKIWEGGEGGEHNVKVNCWKRGNKGETERKRRKSQKENQGGWLSRFFLDAGGSWELHHGIGTTGTLTLQDDITGYRVSFRLSACGHGHLQEGLKKQRARWRRIGIKSQTLVLGFSLWFSLWLKKTLILIGIFSCFQYSLHSAILKVP